MNFNDPRVKETGTPRPKNSQEPKSTSVDQNGALLASISVPQINLGPLLEDEKPAIQDCQYLASYNWLDTKSPTILVPGTTVYASVLCVLIV
jgi:hypothetical protein